MGLRTDFGAIAFDIVLPVSPEQPVWERVLRSSVNWAYTNWKGMTFGLLFAAAALTLLGGVQRRAFKHPWQNTLAGIFFGAPLGVCVNCATPIAQGMYAAGTRLETALATLVSSPTLNPIVLTMAFTLLPWEMGLGHLLAVLAILASLPLVVRTAGAPKTGAVTGTAVLGSPPANAIVGGASYAGALSSVMVSFGRHLLYIAKLALPLMLLAGFLGALVIELVPFDWVAGAQLNAVTLLSVAALAVFLPVPMAFNVIIVMALLSSGLHPGLGMVLLIGLGAYSIYPATVIARYISVPLSLALAGVVAVAAMASGLVVGQYFEQRGAAEDEALVSGLTQPGVDALAQAVAVCEELPSLMQDACFAGNLDEFTQVVPDDLLCNARPSAVTARRCRDLLGAFRAERQAVAARAPEFCQGIVDADLAVQCVTAAVLELARFNHDVTTCDQLGEKRLVRTCRQQYVNSSLLFNPDVSVCQGLVGQERADCDLNAAIYRFADTRDFDGCNDLIAPAQEHCRYVIASAMIGRNRDVSGCLRLTDTPTRQRCESLLPAWEAEEQQSLARCNDIGATQLANTCRLRVARSRIRGQLQDFALSAAVSAESHPAAAQVVAEQPPAAADLYAAGEVVIDSSTLKVAATAYPGKRTAGAAGFERQAGSRLGIDNVWQFSMPDFFEPFIIGKGIAGGDFNNDGWPDVVLATEAGLRVYQNTGGAFELAPVAQGVLAGEHLFIVAFVDANNDGNEDIFASTYGGGNFLLMNETGSFKDARLVELPGGQRLTLAAAFGDLNGDGALDMVLGNWTSGVEKLFSPDQSGNVILYSSGDGYEAVPTGQIKGETNSILLTDWARDGQLDMIVGNDRTVPDLYRRGIAAGFATLPAGDNTIPVSPMFTMSVESADFNNDLLLDFFSTDMTFARSSKQDYCAAARSPASRQLCAEWLQVYEVFDNGSALDCKGEPVARQTDCYIAFSIKAAKALRDPAYCALLPDKRGPYFSLCEHLATNPPPEESIRQSDYIPQVQRNVMLLNRGDEFEDVTERFGVASSFWSWNAQAADLDNDGWQDIYVGNGFHFGDSFYEIQDNILFHNQAGQGFNEVQSEWGLADSVNTPSYVYIDFDRDGDLDIVATGVLVPPRIFVNNQAEHASISLVLVDRRGNRGAIGAEVTISYGGGRDLRQRKQLKLSGGFLSFGNPLHFGLGNHKEVDSISVRWPDGGVSTLPGPLAADRLYRIERKETGE